MTGGWDGGEGGRREGVAEKGFVYDIVPTVSWENPVAFSEESLPQQTRDNPSRWWDFKRSLTGQFS